MYGTYPLDYESPALTTELRARLAMLRLKSLRSSLKTVGATLRLRSRTAIFAVQVSPQW